MYIIIMVNILIGVDRLEWAYSVILWETDTLGVGFRELPFWELTLWDQTLDVKLKIYC